MQKISTQVNIIEREPQVQQLFTRRTKFRLGKFGVCGMCLSAMIAIVCAISFYCDFGISDQMDCIVIANGSFVVMVLDDWSQFDPHWETDTGVGATGIVTLWPYYVSHPIIGQHLDIPLWIPFLVVFIPSLWLCIPKRGIPIGHCAACEYNLTGNVSGICPECGTPIEKKEDCQVAHPLRSDGWGRDYLAAM